MIDEKIVELMARDKCRRAFGIRTDVDKVAQHWALYIPTAKADLAALRAAGYVVVPVEPTNAMIDAGCQVRDATSSREANTYATWRAMIAASQEG